MDLSKFPVMTKAKTGASLLSLSLDRDGGETLQAQLLMQLRRLILHGGLTPGSKLPSSRTLAAELSVSRVTVAAVIDQLISEGYLEGRARSGVFVEAELPDLAPRSATDPLGPAELDEIFQPVPPRPFDVSAPDMAEFPFRQWSRHHDAVWRYPDAELLQRPDPFGWHPLRRAIAEHLAQWRGLRCGADQIIITSGLGEAISILAETLFAPGDAVMTENPGYGAMNRALRRNGLQAVPVVVDDQGFDIRRDQHTVSEAKGVIVTPSRHYPLGVTMPLSRRLELIDWAKQNDGYVIEDDFDSEYRYQGQPLPAMMNLSNDDRVIYVGSFSKVVFSALRLGFVVVPRSLIGRFREGVGKVDPQASVMVQPVMARFMESGDFATHIRRMRRMYSKRHSALVTALERYAGDLLEVDNIPSGMHLVVRPSLELASRLSDDEISKRARQRGVNLMPLSGFFEGPETARGLVLGFAGFDERALEDAARVLADCLRA